MDLDNENTKDRTMEETNKAMKTDTEKREKRSTEMDRTRDFVQSVLSKRKPRLDLLQITPRSAPTSPASNVSEADFVWDDEEGRSVKRRRDDSRGSCSEEAGEQLSSLSAKIRKIIQLIGKEVRTVAEHAKDRNIKKEIKEGAIALTSLMSQIQTSEAQALLHTLGRRVGRMEKLDNEVSKRVRQLEEENKEIKAENASLREEINELVLSGGKRKMKPALFGAANNYEQFVATAEWEWPDNVYSAAFLAAGSPLNAKKGTDLLVFQEEGQQENEAICREFHERYPDLEEMEGKIGAISVITKKINGTGGAEEHERWVYKIELEGDEKDFFEAIGTLEEQMRTKGGCKKVAIYPPAWDLDADRTRKITEWIFRHSNIKCMICRKKQETVFTQTARKRADAIIIKQDGKGYAETLKTVREKIKPNSEEASAIRTIRETRDGSMLLILENGSQKAAEELKRNLKSMGDIKIVKDIKNDNITLFLNEIDGQTTEEDIREVITRETGLEDDLIQVGELRKSFGGNNSVSVSVPKETGEMLLSKEGLRIGLSWCPVKERVDVVKCFRCWQYGHLARDCDATTDASRLCRRCGGEGHLAKDCDSEGMCLTCKKPGHTAGSGKCPEFRKAVAREHLRRRNKKRY